jgi:hypothetical protein
MSSLSRQNAALTRQTLAALPKHGPLLRLVGRLASLGEVEKLTLPEMRCRCWRWWE